MASDGEQSAAVLPTRSVLQTFLTLRNIPPSAAVAAAASPPKRAVRAALPSPAAAAARGARSTAATAAAPPPVWRYFRKRVHGERVAALRAALRTHDDADFRLSRDAYNPTKLPTRFVKVHEEAEDVNTAFRVRTRALFFEREQVDRDVCDRLENRAQYDAQLAEIYSQD